MRIPRELPRAAAPFDVVGYGLNSVDMLVQVEEYPAPNTKQRMRRFARLPGGQAATAMVACARLGWRARYVGRFGDDEHGRFGKGSLDAEGVDTTACSVVPGAFSQFAVILVDAATGDRTVLWDRDPRLSPAPADRPLAAAITGRVLLVDCHETDAAIDMARRAREAGIPTVIDVENVRPRIAELLRLIDIVIAAEGFPAAVTGYTDTGRALAALAAEYKPAVACVTLGREGSLALIEEKEIRTPAFRVPVVDTTGAGDVFRGGFIAGWLRLGAHADAGAVLAYANAVAALKCRDLGARTAIPTADEVEALLRTQTRGR